MIEPLYTLKTISVENIAQTLYMSAKSLASMRECLSKNDLASYLGKAIEPPKHLHSLSVPALLCSSLLRKCWTLYEYPLGEYVERAINRTIATLIYSGTCRIQISRPDSSEEPSDVQ